MPQSMSDSAINYEDGMDSGHSHTEQIKNYCKRLEKGGCSHCNRHVVNLWKCSRCMVATYCDDDCQTKAFHKHKKNCKKIGRRLTVLHKTEKLPEVIQYLNLVNSRDKLPRQTPADVYDDYLSAVFGLARDYHEMGMGEQIKKALEQALNYRFKHLKAILYNEDYSLDSGPLGNPADERFQITRLSLALCHQEACAIACNYICLDKIEEAYNWIEIAFSLDSSTYESILHMKDFLSHRENLEDLLSQPHLMTWHQKKNRKVDATDSFAKCFKNFKLHTRVAFNIVLLKAKLVDAIEKYDKGKQEMEEFLKGTDLKLGKNSVVLKIKQMTPVISKIENFVVPKKKFFKGKDVEEVLSETYRDLDHYLFKIHQSHPDMLYILTGDERFGRFLRKSNGGGIVASQERERLLGHYRFYHLCFLQLQNKDKIISIATSVVNTHNAM